ncbi:MAG TPA: O-antigen ligase family protein [Burkholderiales bacterium]|nr:O-antigen ligase family protein [Burkholderiales bacterium]
MDGSPIAASNRATVMRNSGTIDFTDGCLVVAIAIAMFWAVDPFGLHLWRPSATRHIPILTAVGAVFLGAAGRLLNRPEALQELVCAFRTYLALSVLAVFVIVGSLYARFALGNGNTFITIGVFLLLGGPINLWIVGTSNAPLAMVRSITVVFFGISFLGVAAAAVQPIGLVYHSMEHIVLASMAFPLLFGKKIWFRAIGVVLVVLGTVAPNKLTGYIVMLMIFGWVYLDELMIWTAKDRDRVRAGLRTCLGIMAALLVTPALFVVYQSTKSHLADGNTVFRTHNYEMAFNRFLDSWIWGRGFAAPSVDYFDVFVVNVSTQYLPTHSDPLDILANGGLIAAVPFVLGLLSMILAGWKALDTSRKPGSPHQRDLRPQLAMYFLIVVTGLSVMAFNPVLNQASLAYTYWTASAAMYSLVAAMKTDMASVTPFSEALRGRAKP